MRKLPYLKLCNIINEGCVYLTLILLTEQIKDIGYKDTNDNYIFIN